MAGAAGAVSLSLDIRVPLGGMTLDLAFEAPPGVTVLFGASGAGKTSVLKAVAGLLTPAEGRIAVDGRVLFDGGVNLPPHRRRLGYVFQEPRLFPNRTVAGNLAYGQRFTRRTPPIPRDRIIEVLGIGALLDRRPASLSGGEKQRVAIGRALMAAPDILLADEPLAALDGARKDEILGCFEALRDDLSIPMLYVTHDAAEVARLATTVVVLDQGRITHMGPPSEVLSDPQVTPLGAGRAGAVVEARVASHHADGLSELRVGALPLLVPQVARPVGAGLRVRIEAADVMLATTRPEAISALNIWPGVVRDIRRGQGPGALVQLDCDGARVLARVTARSVEALALAPGQEVFAVLKAVSVAREAIGGQG